MQIPVTVLTSWGYMQSPVTVLTSWGHMQSRHAALAAASPTRRMGSRSASQGLAGAVAEEGAAEGAELPAGEAGAAGHSGPSEGGAVHGGQRMVQAVPKQVLVFWFLN